MGKALSRIKNPFRNFNIEDRAHRVISRDKPIAAPKYASDVLDYENLLRNHPEVVAESLKKHETLNKHLKDVFVTSEDPIPKTMHNAQSSGTKPLPMNRHIVEDYELGFKEMDKVSLGKASLRTIMSFIGQYQKNPKLNNAEKIAKEYDLDENKVRNILEYIRVYEIYIPDDRKTKAKFAGPSLPKPIVTKIPRPQLLSGWKNNEKT